MPEWMVGIGIWVSLLLMRIELHHLKPKNRWSFFLTHSWSHSAPAPLLFGAHSWKLGLHVSLYNSNLFSMWMRKYRKRLKNREKNWFKKWILMSMEKRKARDTFFLSSDRIWWCIYIILVTIGRHTFGISIRKKEETPSTSEQAQKMRSC